MTTRPHVRYVAGIVGLGFLLGLPPAFSADDHPPLENIDAVLECMRANAMPAIWSSRIEMTTVDVGGYERQLSGQIYADLRRDSANVSIRLEQPADLAGVTYLMRRKAESSDIYVYLPALQHPRRLPETALDGSLFGTDLSFNEVSLLTTAFNLAWLDLPGTVDGRKAYKVNIWPQTGLSPRYKQIRLMVDQRSCVALRFDLMDAGGSKKLILVDSKSLKEIDGHWIAPEFELQQLENGTRTKVKLVDTKKLEKPPAQVFEPTTFWTALH